MRIPVTLLALCAAITGCNSSVDSAHVDTIVISSNPTAAAVRLNGEAVGRTPATIKVDRTKNYELQVGKGGFLTETSELKPRLITTSDGVEFGFPASVRVNLTKVPAGGEAGIPAADKPEFKDLSKKALGEDVAKENLKSDLAATKEAAAKIQAALAAREAASKARLADIAKSIAAAKAGNGGTAAKAQLAEAELALKQANADVVAARAQAEKNLQTVEARRLALAGPEANVVAAKTKVASAKIAAQPSAANIGQLEQGYLAEIKALNEAQSNSNAAIKALNARADELTRAAAASTAAAKAEAAKGLADLQKALEEQKAVAALANEALAQAKADAIKNAEAMIAEANKVAEKTVADAAKNAEAMVAEANAKAAEANKVAEKTLADERLAAEAKIADANAKAAEANKVAEKTLADERLAAEAKIADANAKVVEANKVAEANKSKAEALKYSEFSSRYALLENRRRSKAITEEEYKAALSDLRKELGL